ncbi:MAG TPA: bifunctional oligoribonuclease/PAP phosphatase NrnA [bacterium]|nr:bifunctional oligoribonuclease/PAP phosphatase NrnA [bacterium]
MSLTFPSKDLEQLKVFLHKAQKILVLGHINPDGDCYGAILAWHQYLKSIGKNHDLFAAGRHDAAFDFLPGYFEVKNLPEDLADDYDLAIINDLNDFERTGLADFFVQHPDLKKVQVDHHNGKVLKVDLAFNQDDCAAACQVLYFLWKDLQLTINKEMAQALLTGIISDSNNYQTSAVTVETFEASADLQSLGADPVFIGRQIHRLPLNKLRFLGEILEKNLVLKPAEKLIVAVVPLDLWEKYDLPISDLDLLYSWLLGVQGYEHVLALKEQAVGEIRVSWRSKGAAELNRLSAIFGGGGHAQAASFTLRNHKITIDDDGNYRLKAI